MKRVFYILVIGFCFSCQEENSTNAIREVSESELNDSINQYPIEREIINFDTNQFHRPTNPIDSIGNVHMKESKLICDSLLISFFGKKIFSKNIKFDKKLSGGNLTNKKGDVEIFNFNKKVDYRPHLY